MLWSMNVLKIRVNFFEEQWHMHYWNEILSLQKCANNGTLLKTEVARIIILYND